RPTHRGRWDEWHLVLPNPLEPLTFGLVPWFREAREWLGSALLSARLIAVGAVPDPVAGDRVKQHLVMALPNPESSASQIAIKGRNASSVWTAPLKLTDRGSMPCLLAA